MNIQEKNEILRNLSARVGNRVWKVVDKINQTESRELFAVPVPVKSPAVREWERDWTK